jgi:dynein heavy chain
VADRFLENMSLGGDLREVVGHHMAFVHEQATILSERFIKVERRFNYTTPKSFLELIDFYKKLFDAKNDVLQDNLDRMVRSSHVISASAQPSATSV